MIYANQYTPPTPSQLVDGKPEHTSDSLGYLNDKVSYHADIEQYVIDEAYDRYANEGRGNIDYRSPMERDDYGVREDPEAYPENEQYWEVWYEGTQVASWEPDKQRWRFEVGLEWTVEMVNDPLLPKPIGCWVKPEGEYSANERISGYAEFWAYAAFGSASMKSFTILKPYTWQPVISPRCPLNPEFNAEMLSLYKHMSEAGVEAHRQLCLPPNHQ